MSETVVSRDKFSAPMREWPKAQEKKVIFRCLQVIRIGERLSAPTPLTNLTT